MWKVEPYRRLEVVSLQDLEGVPKEWNGDWPRKMIFEFVDFDGENPDLDRVKKFFLAYDDEAPELKKSYKFPFAIPYRGEPVAIYEGLRAAASRLPKADLPEDIKKEMKEVINEYFQKYRNKEFIRIVKEGPDEVVLEGYAVIFHSVDLEGEKFVPETRFFLDEMMPKRIPVTWRHEASKIIGYADNFEVDDIGLKMTFHITDREYFQVIQDLIEKRELGVSTGSAGHMVIRRDGIILQWPIVEVALTPSPAEPKTMDYLEITTLAKEFPCLSGFCVNPSADTGEAGVEGWTDEGQEENPENLENLENHKEEEAMELKEVLEKVDTLAEEIRTLKKEFSVIVRNEETEEAPLHAALVKMYHGDVKEVVWNPFGRRNEYKEEGGKAYVATKGLTGLGRGTELASSLFFQALAEESLPRTHGATIYPAKTDSGIVPGIGLIQAYWINAGAPVTEAVVSGAGKAFSVKKLAAYLPVNREDLEDVDYNLEAMIEKGFAVAFGEAETAAFIRGASGGPSGLNAQGTAFGSVGGPITYDVLVDVWTAFRTGVKGRVRKPVWIMNPALVAAIAKLKDSNGNPLFPELFTDRPRIFGVPVVESTTIPTNLGAGNNETELYIVDLASEVVVVKREIEIASMRKVVTDQVEIAAYERVDFVLLHDGAAVFAEGIQV